MVEITAKIDSRQASVLALNMADSQKTDNPIRPHLYESGVVRRIKERQKEFIVAQTQMEKWLGLTKQDLSGIRITMEEKIPQDLVMEAFIQMGKSLEEKNKQQVEKQKRTAQTMPVMRVTDLTIAGSRQPIAEAIKRRSTVQ